MGVITLSIRSKLLIGLLLVSLACLGAGGVLGYRAGDRALHGAVIDHLEGERVVERLRVEAYLASLRRSTAEIGGSRFAADAVVALSRAFDGVEAGPSAAAAGQLRAWYRAHYLPALDRVSGGHAEVGGLLPERPGGLTLQAALIAGVPAAAATAPGPDAAALAAYLAVRARFDAELDRESAVAGFSDLLLVDAATGDVVYSVRRDPDFATNLLHGPYANSSAALAFRAALDPRTGGRVVLQDFTTYEPARFRPELFTSVPVEVDGRTVGVFLAAIGVGALDDVVTDDHDWRGTGEGETGEVIMVGADRLFRSQSRFLFQDPDRFLRDLRGEGVPAATLAQIRALHSTVLLLSTRTAGIEQSFRGHSGSAQFLDYRGAPVIGAFGPVHDRDVQWAVEAKQDLSEAFAPLARFQRNLLLAAALASIVLSALALIFIGAITRPLFRVLAGMAALRDKGLGERVAVHGRDEFAELAQGYNRMADAIGERDAIIAGEADRRLALLRRFLPGVLADRFAAADDAATDEDDDETASDAIGNVTVVAMVVDGQDALALALPATETRRRLAAVHDALGEAARASGVEPAGSFGENVVAVSGLSRPRLDHAVRALNFATASIAAVERLGRDWPCPVSLRVGVCSGEVAVGAVGRPPAAFDLWGHAVAVARRAARDSPPNAIRVTDSVLALLPDTTGFVPAPPIALAPGMPLRTWTRTPPAPAPRPDGPVAAFARPDAATP